MNILFEHTLIINFNSPNTYFPVEFPKLFSRESRKNYNIKSLQQSLHLNRV